MDFPSRFPICIIKYNVCNDGFVLLLPTEGKRETEYEWTIYRLFVTLL